MIILKPIRTKRNQIGKPDWLSRIRSSFIHVKHFSGSGVQADNQRSIVSSPTQMKYIFDLTQKIRYNTNTHIIPFQRSASQSSKQNIERYKHTIKNHSLNINLMYFIYYFFICLRSFIRLVFPLIMIYCFPVRSRRYAQISVFARPFSGGDATLIL